VEKERELHSGLPAEQALPSEARSDTILDLVFTNIASFHNQGSRIIIRLQ
jgi:hypothetical protein